MHAEINVHGEYSKNEFVVKITFKYKITSKYLCDINLHFLKGNF